ncbi:hypothetical protein AAG906_021016 [Vitis piasezkii]
MFEAIQYLVSSKKLEDGFCMDNVALVNSIGKISRSCDDNMGLDLQFIQNNIARRLWQIFLQDIHVLVFHGPNGLKIIIDQIIAKN